VLSAQWRGQSPTPMHNRDEPVELARCRHRTRRQAAATEETRPGHPRHELDAVLDFQRGNFCFSQPDRDLAATVTLSLQSMNRCSIS
jgi:hypothetical protein